MRKLLIVIGLIISSSLFAQTFAPIGATWYYDYDDGVGGYMAYIRSEKDTVIQSKNCKQLGEYLIYENQNLVNDQIVSKWDTLTVGKRYVYLENDTIFYWGNNVFLPLYAFNIPVGDTAVFNDGTQCENLEIISCNSFTFKVDSVDTVNLNGVDLRVQYSSKVMNSTWSYFFLSYPEEGNKVFELIGSTTYFFGRSQIFYTLEGPKHTLRCYDDGQGVVYKKYPNLTNCAYKPQFPSSVNTISKTAFSLFPNPVADVINIKLENTENVNYSIIDITGKVIQNGLLNSSTIDVSKLDNGIYSLQLSNKEGFLGTAKWIKQ